MAKQVKPIPEGYHTVTPAITFKDSLEAIKFYKKAFGAEELDIFPAPDGKSTMHATIKIGESIIMMGDENPNQACKSAEALGSSPIAFFVYVPNVDSVFKQAVISGGEITMELADMFWGDRCGTIKDPFGYSWTIATHIKDMTKQEMQNAADSFFAEAARK